MPLLILALLLGSAVAAGAQDVVRAFAELPRVVDKGNVVFVQDDAGERTKGSITELSDKSLEIMTSGIPGRTVTFPADRVTRVSKVDSRLNGFVIGAVAGAVPGLLLGHGFRNWCENESGSNCGTAYAYAGGVFALVGGWIGRAIDGAVDGQTLVFRRP